MRCATLIFAILCASVALGSDRLWKNAKVIKISSESGTGWAAPRGTWNIRGQVTKTYYWIETDDTVYVLGPSVTKEWLKVTLHSTTKIVIDGGNAHILDDEGKDKKMPIAEKVARTKPEDRK